MNAIRKIQTPLQYYLGIQINKQLNFPRKSFDADKQLSIINTSF